MSKLNIEFKESLASTLRAIVADQSLQVEFSEDVFNNFFTWNQNLVKKKRVVTHESRAACDLVACYLLFHDSALHQPEECQEFFDEFEKIRVIAEVKNSYRGVVENILTKVECDLSSIALSDGLHSHLSLILLDEIFSKNFSNDLKQNLSKNIIQAIKNLSKETPEQKLFAQGVAKVLAMLKNQQAVENSNQKEQEESGLQNDLVSSNQENTEEKEEKKYQQAGVSESKKEPEISEIKSDERKGEVMVSLEKSETKEDRIEFKKSYKIYTIKFDEVIFPQKLVSKNELETLRGQLNLRLAKLNATSRKMTLKLKRKLLSKRDLFLEFDSSRGILDRKKLTRLVTKPLNDDIWVNSKNHQYQDTALTILLDNSGSMRGQPIVMSALACEIIAEILEKFCVKTEIIGFTTADWKGGKARKLWENSGRIKNPGRLNELRHIIYKHFNQKFKQAKINLGLMLKEGVLKENIDGEALLFARSRLMRQSEKRKILLVISDGTPVDDSTNSANDSDILTDHLHQVIKKIEKGRKVEIVGIGIGHATDEFYRNSTSIKSLEELGDVMIEKVVDLL